MFAYKQINGIHPHSANYNAAIYGNPYGTRSLASECLHVPYIRTETRRLNSVYYQFIKFWNLVQIPDKQTRNSDEFKLAATRFARNYDS